MVIKTIDELLIGGDCKTGVNIVSDDPPFDRVKFDKRLEYILGDGSYFNATTHNYWINEVFRILDTLGLSHKGLSFLDWGCGTGTMVIYAARSGFLSYGIEQDKDHLDLAMENVVKASESGFIPTN